MPTSKRFRIEVTEHERGWGQNSWYEYFDTRAEAQAAIHQVNSANTAPTAPDYYLIAGSEIVQTSSHMKEI